MGTIGNDHNLIFTAAGGPGPSPIPEPGTWAAMAIFAGGAAYARWCRRGVVFFWAGFFPVIGPAKVVLRPLSVCPRFKA